MEIKKKTNRNKCRRLNTRGQERLKSGEGRSCGVNGAGNPTLHRGWSWRMTENDGHQIYRTHVVRTYACTRVCVCVCSTQSSLFVAQRLQSTGNEPSQFQMKTVTKTCRIRRRREKKEMRGEANLQLIEKRANRRLPNSDCILCAFTIIIVEISNLFAGSVWKKPIKALQNDVT